MASLKTWWESAKAHGRVYWFAEKLARDGMGRHYYSLWTLAFDEQGHPYLARAWPGDDDGTYDEKLAKKLGFSLTHRTWMRSGCGYDRPHDVVYSIARALDGHGPETLKSLPRTESMNCYEAR
jgi:hypothetical protein